MWALLGAVLAGIAMWWAALTLMPEEVDWLLPLLVPPVLSAAVGAVIGSLSGALWMRELKQGCCHTS